MTDTAARPTAEGRRPRAEGAPLGPGSILWSIAGDPRSLIPGTAAGIMQLMLPGLGAGVTDHSNFFEDPFDRIFRSIPYIWGSIFAADEGEGEVRGREIRDFHPDIKGTDDQGRKYHALDPDVYWWAHATFTWEMFRAQELYMAKRPSRAEQEQLYRETVTWYRRYGVSDRPVPLTLDAFEARFEEICRTELELTPAVQWVLDPDKNPSARREEMKLKGPLAPLSGFLSTVGAEAMRTMVYGAMPDVVRRRFDFPWTNKDRLAYVAICGALQASGPLVRRGFLAEAWPEGTPHLDLTDPSGTKVVVAPPNPKQHRRRPDEATGEPSGDQSAARAG